MCNNLSHHRSCPKWAAQVCGAHMCAVQLSSWNATSANIQSRCLALMRSKPKSDTKCREPFAQFSPNLPLPCISVGAHQRPTPQSEQRSPPPMQSDHMSWCDHPHLRVCRLPRQLPNLPSGASLLHVKSANKPPQDIRPLLQWCVAHPSL